MIGRLRDGVEFARRARRPLPDAFWGGVYVALSFTVLAGFVVLGHQLAVLAAAARGDIGAPSFERTTDRVRSGANAALVTLAYGVPPLAALGVVATRVVSFPSGLVPTVSVTPVDAAVAVVAAPLPVLLVPPALLAYHESGRLGAAFAPSAFRPLASGRYLGVALGVAVVAVAVVPLLALGTAFTYGSLIVLVPFILFSLFTVLNYALGTAYGEAVGDLDPAERGSFGFEDEPEF
ncbi:MAG: DUF4013 domain-containing protein [Haloferacaceae archaeon]